jgi:hypothetical protein
MWINSDVNNATTGKYLYDHIRSWQPAACRFEILGLTIDPKQEHLAVCMANNNIGIVDIKSIGLNEEK